MPEVDLSELSIPMAECIALRIGRVCASTLAEAELKGYDDLPLLGRHGGLVGFISTEQAREIYQGRADIVPEDPRLKRSVVPVIVDLGQFLEVLGSQRIVGVVDQRGGVLGIVTISDLNRHEFRATLYPLLARFEGQLARLVENKFADPWLWFNKLGASKVDVVGHWECLKREGLNVGATVGASMTQLLTVVEKTPELASLLFESGTAFKRFKGRTIKYRNAVMHPARPLVLAPEDVVSLKKFVEQLAKASEALISLRL